MSSAAPRRRVDTNRRRTGCQGCRSRRKKCDETHPQCVACVQRGLNCVYQRPLIFKGFNERIPESPGVLRQESTRKSIQSIRVARKRPIPNLGSLNVPADYQHSERSPKPHSKPYLSPGLHSVASSRKTSFSWTRETSCSPYPPVSSLIGQPNKLSTEEMSPRMGFPQIRRRHNQELASPDSHHRGNTGQFKLFDDDIFEGVETEDDDRYDESSIHNQQNPAQTPSSLTGHSQSLGESPQSGSDCSLTRSSPLELEVEEALLMYFEQKVLPRTPVYLGFPQPFYKNSCFRASVLALSSSFLSMDLNQGGENAVAYAKLHAYGRNDKINWRYYDAAVKSLNEQLERPRNESLEQLASAALLLAYHDIEVGTPLGVRNHACGLDALASRMEFSVCLTPGLFKAWRMLRCDRKFLSLATRKTITTFDAYDMSSVLDQQIAIREVLIGLWKLHSRYFMEATFVSNSQPESPLPPPFSNSNLDSDGTRNLASPSERASQWLQLVLNRDCDRHQAQQKDFYSDCLTQHAIQQQCAYFDKQLDQWYGGVADYHLPVVKAFNDRDFVTADSVSDVLVTYRLPDDSKALDHILYSLSRMISNYLRSLFNARKEAHFLEAWAKLILGIICGMGFRRQTFTLFRVDMLLLITALLSEGTRVVMMILEHVIPYIQRIDGDDPGFFTWSYLKTILQLIIRERHQGRSIRLIIDDSIQDSEQRHIAARHRVVAFGDSHEKGQFKDVYSVD